MTEALKILVIEDSEDDRELYRRALRKDTDVMYDIVETEDGDHGFERIDPEAPPACILLDYSLPGRNGVEVLKRIRSKHPFVPVVMLTGQGNEKVAVSAMQEGAQNYISKANITPDAIQRVIRVAIEHCAMEKRIHEQRTSLEVFTRALAHDLKEPVRTIRSFLDLLATREDLSPKGKAYFHYIQSAADRMSMLIDTVYFYTRLDGSPQEIGKEVCDVAAVLEEAKENIGELIRERKATITSDQLPHIQVNRMQLLQVLQNLLVNAIRHCEIDPVIHIRAAEGPDHWLFRVTDNGPGIDDTQAQRIFEPFKRMSYQKEQGLGLGLAICKKIIESHGGKIWYEAAPERGAVFLFTLPKQQEGTAKKRASTNTQPVQKQSGPNGQTLANILLVEDNEADIELTRIMLLEEARLRCNLLVAHDAAEAMTLMRAEAFKTGAVDLMLLDINMPGMDGFELLEAMRREDGLREVPVVMCTTSTYDKDMARAQSLGVVGYLTKPAEIRKLKSVIDRASGVRLCEENGGYALVRAA